MPTNTSVVTLVTDGDVEIVTIDAPGDDLNLMTPQLHDELVEAISHLRRASTARAVILRAEGKAFSGGGDIDRMMPRLADHVFRERIHAHTRQILTDFLDIPMPVVVAINGDAVALAANMALLADVVVMSSHARLIDPHVLVGLVAGDGGAVAWPMLIGHMRAKRYLLTGDPISADEAERIGLVTEVVAAETLAERARAWATRLAEGAPLALAYTKRAVNAQLRAAILTSLETSVALEMLSMHSNDHRDAVAAFREGRRPEFKGQ